MKKSILCLTAVVLLCAGTTQAQKRPLYKIHSTAQTKTITIDGGIRLMGWFSNGFAVVAGKSNWFVINKQGNVVFSLQKGFEPKPTQGQNGFIGYDNNRLMVYSSEEKRAIVYNTSGSVVKEFKDAVGASGFCDGVALVAFQEKNPKGWGSVTKWYYIDINGNKISKTMPISKGGWFGNDPYRLFKLANGLARVKDDKSNKWGFRNQKCEWVIQPTFYSVHGFSDGLAVAQQEESGKWGYIDTKGNWAIQPVFSNEPGDFNAGRAKVTDKTNCVHYIDKTGRIVWTDPDPVRCNEYGSFMSTGYALWCFAPREGYLVDTSFKKRIRLPEFFNHISDYGKDYYVLPEGPGHDGTKVFDWNGNLLLEYKDQNDGGGNYFSEGIGKMKNYYFNLQGEIIVKFEDTRF